MIRLTRRRAYADKLRAYHVLLDGQDIGAIREGETREFPVIGRHNLQLKVDWCRSRTLEFDASETTVDFECGTNLGGPKFFLAAYYAFFKRNDYIWLKQTVRA